MRTVLSSLPLASRRLPSGRTRGEMERLVTAETCAILFMSEFSEIHLGRQQSTHEESSVRKGVHWARASSA